MTVEDYSKARSKRNQNANNPTMFTRKPYISEKSKRMAEQARTRTDQEGHQDIVEHLLQKEKTLGAMKQAKNEEARMKQLQKEDIELSFHPNTLNYPNQPPKKYKHKRDELYARVKPNSLAANKGKKGTDEDPEFLRQKHECTGRPKINAIGAHLVTHDRDLNQIWGVEA